MWLHIFFTSKTIWTGSLDGKGFTSCSLELGPVEIALNGNKEDYEVDEVKEDREVKVNGNKGDREVKVEDHEGVHNHETDNEWRVGGFRIYNPL